MLEDTPNQVNVTDSFTSSIWEEWGLPILVDTRVYDDRIELIYEQESNVTYTVTLGCPPSINYRRVYKEVYRAEGDKLVCSSKIFGEIIPARDESYEFDDED